MSIENGVSARASSDLLALWKLSLFKTQEKLVPLQQRTQHTAMNPQSRSLGAQMRSLALQFAHRGYVSLNSYSWM